MKNILVLGSTGMAGHVVTLHLERIPNFKVYNLSHKKKLNDESIIMDVMEIHKFNELLDSLKLDVIINCIGILNEDAEKNIDKAVFLNGYLPHYLEYKYKNTKTKIIHISTDCVFSGKDGNYYEESFKDGDNIYARSKAIGEIINNKDLTFRTSIIGPDINYDGIGLFNWFMKSKGKIYGYKKAIWSGISTIELAKSVVSSISQELTGLYHLVPDKAINKYELLHLLKNEFRRNDIDIIKFDYYKIDKSLINTRSDFSYKIPLYEDMIKDMKIWIDENKSYYHHY